MQGIERVPEVYRHSNVVPARAWLGGVAVAGSVGAGMGLVGGYIELYVHAIPIGKLSGVILIVGTLLVGKSLGIVAAKTLMRFKGRSVRSARGLALLATLTYLYAAWITFFYAWLEYSHHAVALWLIARPDILARLIAGAYDQGVWSLFGGGSIAGPPLAAVWLGEAAMVAVVAWKEAGKRLDDVVFCEQCQTWGARRHLMQIQADNPEALAADLAKGLDCLLQAREYRGAGNSWADVTLEGCPLCNNLQALSVEHTVVMTGSNGKSVRRSTLLLRRRMLTPAEAETVIQAAIEVPQRGKEEPSEAAPPDPNATSA